MQSGGEVSAPQQEDSSSWRLRLVIQNSVEFSPLLQPKFVSLGIKSKLNYRVLFFNDFLNIKTMY